MEQTEVKSCGPGRRGARSDRLFIPNPETAQMHGCMSSISPRHNDLARGVDHPVPFPKKEPGLPSFAIFPSETVISSFVNLVRRVDDVAALIRMSG